MSSGSASDAFYLLDEAVTDQALKTQVVQNFVLNGVPTAAELEREVLARYNQVRVRTGFRYHRYPTNIYIYVFPTEAQANAGQGLWVAMLARTDRDSRPASVIVNAERLAALSEPEHEVFGLSESERLAVFQAITLAEHRANDEADRRFSAEQFREQATLSGQLRERYMDEVAAEYGLTRDNLQEIAIEGMTKGWVAVP